MIEFDVAEDVSVVIHEQNAVAGLTNRVLARLATLGGRFARRRWALVGAHA
jgi:hypothetical protein